MKTIKKYKNKYRSDTTRLKNHDYGSDDWYFVTICTKNRERYFGEIIQHPNEFGPQSQNLASVIRGFKAAVKKYATMNDIPFAWQSRYHEYVVRKEIGLQRIRKYVQNNPNKWISKLPVYTI